MCTGVKGVLPQVNEGSALVLPSDSDVDVDTGDGTDVGTVAADWRSD